MNGYFRNFVLQNFPFLEDDFDALTDYQLFCKMMGYIKKFAKDNDEFKKLLENLQPYIDEKLDEMAADGTLADIINEEIFNDLNDEIGDLTNLTTTNKSNLVSAINELNSSSDVVPFYCIIRPTSNGWIILNDTDHTPLNVQSVEIESGTGRLKINHSVTGATKIYSFSISPDETFSKYGIRAGASVGTSYSYIDIYQTITANAYFRYQNDGFNLQAEFSNLVKSYEYDSTKHCLRVTFDDNLRSAIPKYWDAVYNFAPNQSSQFTTVLKTLWTDYNVLEVYAYDSNNDLIEDESVLDRVNVIYKIDSKILPADLVSYPIAGSNFWICGYLKKTS